MTVEYIARLTCDVPDCTNSVEVGARGALNYDDDCELEHDTPEGWLDYQSCRCPNCNERWRDTQFEVGDRVRFKYAARVYEGVIKYMTRDHELRRRYRVDVEGIDEPYVVDDWLMVKVQS